MIDLKNQKGQNALLITLVFLSVILSIGIWLTSLTVKEMRMASNVEESLKALNAADSGIEHALFRLDQGDFIDQLCSSGWTTLDNGSQYCLEVTEGTIANPEAIKSIGNFNDVERAVLFSRVGVINPDQYSNFTNLGPDPCTYAAQCSSTCDAPGATYDEWLSVDVRRVGQTFQADMTGDLIQITVWRGSRLGGGIGGCYGYWRIQLRDVENGRPGNQILATSNNISVGSTGGCGEKNLTFSPYRVYEGEKYSFVVLSTRSNGSENTSDDWDGHRCRLKMAEDGFYPGGRAWWSDRSNTWQTSCYGSPCPDAGSDLMFEVAIDPFSGGTSGIMGDLEETKP